MLLAGDPSHFLESNSTDSAIEAKQSKTSWFVTHDDAERPRGQHKNLVGSYNAGAKVTISRGTSEKVGGLCQTKNWKKNEKIEEKIVEGRAIIFNMEKVYKKDLDVSNKYDMRTSHLQSMDNGRLPRDYMASFVGHFTFDDLEEQETHFQKVHKIACELISEVKPQYEDRRLFAQALLLAMFLLLQSDVEKLDDEVVSGLFVEVFDDMANFFKSVVEEMDKADEVIEKLREETNFRDD